MRATMGVLHGIIPPYMLETIANRGNAVQRQRALRMLALSGQFRGRRQAVAAVAPLLLGAPAMGKRRTTFDAQHGTSLPGVLVRAEGDSPVADVAVNEAYDGAGATYDLYWDVYGRNSIDGNGLRLDATVHYDRNYDNAFWDGQQMVYGDGDEDLPPDQRLFNRFTIAIDVIGHELTHGVTQYTVNLVYQDQPGALNESISDVFGSLVKQRALGQTAAQADWLIGEGLFTANVQGVALRSMRQPGSAYDDSTLGKDPQPANMSGYVQTSADNGGVHINSGIPNHAFYVTAVQIGGNAWEKAGLIWYRALRDKLQQGSQFQDAAGLTFQVAGELYGTNSLEQQAVRQGWAEVGIAVAGQAQGSGCLTAVAGVIAAVVSPRRGR
jgi:Zn-dependent metalloprotease